MFLFSRMLSQNGSPKSISSSDHTRNPDHQYQTSSSSFSTNTKIFDKHTSSTKDLSDDKDIAQTKITTNPTFREEKNQFEPLFPQTSPTISTVTEKAEYMQYSSDLGNEWQSQRQSETDLGRHGDIVEDRSRNRDFSDNDDLL